MIREQRTQLSPVSWTEFRRRLNRRRRVMILAVSVYPLFVGTGAVTLALTFAPAEILRRVLPEMLRDALFIGIGLWIGGIAILPVFGKRSIRNRWYAILAQLERSLSEKKTLPEALASIPAPEVPKIIEHLFQGVTFVDALQIEGCPPSIYTALGTSSDLLDLERRIADAVERHQSSRLTQVDRWKDRLQPVTIAVAGAIVLWIVLRIIIPSLNAHFSVWSTLK